jgi:hypothetical protein
MHLTSKSPKVTSKIGNHIKKVILNVLQEVMNTLFEKRYLIQAKRLAFSCQSINFFLTFS